MTARSDAQALHERKPATVLELDLDYCLNSWGEGVCTAGRTTESGTAQAGTATTLTLRAAASAVDDTFNGMFLALRTGPGSVQSRKITDYVGASKVATLEFPWRVNRVARSEEIDLWSGPATVAANTYADPDGVVTLDTLTDDDAGNFEARSPGSMTVPNDSATYVLSALVKKDLLATHRSGWNIALSGGTPVNVNARFAQDGSNLASCTAVDVGYGLLLVTATITNNTSGNTTLNISAYPATAATKGGADNVAGVGSMTMGRLHVRLSTESGDYIKTGAAAIVLPTSATTYDVLNRANACYNVFSGASPCQDKPNFLKGTKVIKFCDRGMTIPGEQIRPYILKVSATPTEIDPVKCLSARSQTTVTMADEPCRDDLDKYAEQRSAPAGGTYWTRLLARNPNAIGRFARARRGYAVLPWDWSTFQTELYVIEVMKGPAKDDTVQVTVSDAIKLLDRVMLPVATGGKLVAALPAVENTGFLQSATSTTALLATAASAVDDIYNGMELHIVGGLGFGQKRVITDYAGSTRTCTVSAWSVTPDSTSIYEVGHLSLNVGTGKGAEYADPVATGRQEFVCIGDEVIRYTARSGDVLSWPDTSYREQFDTVREDHKIGDGVQQCLAFVNDPATFAVQNIMNRGAIEDAYIDTAKLAELETQWYGAKALITACITHPEKGSGLLADLLVDLNLMVWWHPVEQRVQAEVNAPVLGAVDAYTDEDFVLDSTEVEKLDKHRLTRSAVYFDLASATADAKKATNYRTVFLYVDADSEGPNGYDDVRADVRYSRWMKTANAVFVGGVAGRRLRSRNTAPVKLKAELDPRSEPVLGALVDLTTRKIPGADGNAVLQKHRVVKVVDAGARFNVEFRSTSFGRRYGFICPNGYPAYASASADQRLRAFIAANSGSMSDGSSAYLII